MVENIIVAVLPILFQSTSVFTGHGTHYLAIQPRALASIIIIVSSIYSVNLPSKPLQNVASKFKLWSHTQYGNVLQVNVHSVVRQFVIKEPSNRRASLSQCYPSAMHSLNLYLNKEKRGE